MTEENAPISREARNRERRSRSHSLELPRETTEPWGSLTRAERNYLKRAREAVNRTDDHETASSLKSAFRCNTDAMICQCTLSGALAVITLECKKKFCPWCVKTWSESLKRRMLERLTETEPEKLHHLVLTIPNGENGELQSRIHALFSSFREWRKQGRRKNSGGWWRNVEGYAWKLEIDKKKNATWHPHLHILLICEGGFNFRRNSKARDAWIRITENFNAKANPGAQYITRCESANVALEVAKYAAKPLQLSALNVDEIIEAAASTRGKRFHGSVGNLALGAEKGDGSGSYEQLGRLTELIEEITGKKYTKAKERLLERILDENELPKRLTERIEELKHFEKPHKTKE